MRKVSIAIVVLLAVAFVSCKEKKKIQEIEPVEEVIEFYEPKTETIASEVVLGVSNYIKNSFLTEADLKVIPSLDRQFRLYATDLNGDGKNEIFVSLVGSGGCTMLLLDSNYKLITKFTVMQGSIFVEPKTENDWKVLMVKSEGEWKYLVYADGTYPSNPSVVEKSKQDGPSGQAVVIFDEAQKLDIYEF